MRNEEPFYERLRREDKIRNDKKRKESIKKRARLTYSAAYTKSGHCILNLMRGEDYAKKDEARANKALAKKNQEEDERKDQLEFERSRKMMETSMTNFNKMASNSKSLRQEAEEKYASHPANDSAIYATIKIPEIVKGLTPEDIKQMEKDKAQYQKMIMDEYNR